jgi:subtilisin family serine protease
MIKRGVWVCFAILIILTILLSVSSNVYGKDSGVKVSSEVTKALNEDGKARVIVTLKDNNDFDSKGKLTASASSSRTNVIEDIGKNKVKNEFSSFNGFSAALTADEITKLEGDDRVESIQYDMPVSIFLQDSVLLINASRTWQVQQSGINITGAGETICIIDTGVDYTHPDLGNCTIKNLSLDGTVVDNVTESMHNYTNNYNNTWNITMPGFSKIAVHFVNISLEYQGEVGGFDTFDRITIYDGNMNVVASYHGINGIIQDLWSPSVEGDTIYVRLKTDGSFTDYGFYIDSVIDGTTNTTYNWSSCNKVVNGWDMVNNDPDPMDDHGHGTHVAGIAAANGAIKGVAPDAKIIAVKAMNSAGQGWESDVISGIEWCTNSSLVYNISVISMSLGTNCATYPDYCYSSYCDGPEYLYRNAINAAVRKNISVIIASGNNGNTTAISSPACIQNATAVGATDKYDVIADYSNRNGITDLFAPGSDINSTCSLCPIGFSSCTGIYAKVSGTSMATPHVAGAFALVRQFYKLQNGFAPTPAYIQSELNKTGKLIDDSAYSGYNFSRINILAAIMDINQAPNVSFASPLNKTYNTTSISISISNSSDAIYVWWYNESVNLTYAGNIPYGFADGQHTILAWANDSFGKINSTSITFKVDTIFPTINFTSLTTANGSYSQSWIRVNVTANDTNLDKIVINLYNSTALVNSTSSATSTSPLFVNIINLADGTYWLNATVNDSAGNINWTETRVITLDNAPPLFTSIWPANSSWTNGLFNVSLNEPGFCWLVFNGTNYTMTNNSGMTEFSYTNNTVSESSSNNTLNVTFYCNDTLGHLNSSETRFFGIDTTAPTISLNGPENGNSTNLSTMTASYTVNDLHIIASCSLTFDGSIQDSDSLVPNGTEQHFNTVVLIVGDHNWYVSCIDEAGNTKISETRSITRTSTSSSSSSSSSSTTTDSEAAVEKEDYTGTIYNISSTSLMNETSRLLRQFDKLIFRVNNTTHRLTILNLNVSRNWTKLQIQSGIIVSEFRVGDEKKFDASGDGYNDLYVRLSNVKSPLWANITIKEIYEKAIVNVTTSAGVNETAGKITGFSIKQELGNLWNNAVPFIKENMWWFIGGGIVAIIAIGVFILHRKGYRFNFHIIEHKEFDHKE